MRDNCKWKEECVFCETYGHCAVEIHDIHYRNGRIEVFHIYSPQTKDVNIIGVYDTRYFEELEDPLLYYVDDELQWEFPDNPYPTGTAAYANYQEMVESLPPIEELLELFFDDLDIGFRNHDGYALKVDKIGNFNDKSGVAPRLIENKTLDSRIICDYYKNDFFPQRWGYEY